MLRITNGSIKYQSFVYAQLNSQTVLFQWQWRGTLHSPNLQYYWRLTIRLFSVIYRTLVGVGWRVLSLCSDAVGVFYSPCWMGCIILRFSSARSIPNSSVFRNLFIPNTRRVLSGWSSGLRWAFLSYPHNTCLGELLIAWRQRCPKMVNAEGIEFFFVTATHKSNFVSLHHSDFKEMPTLVRFGFIAYQPLYVIPCQIYFHTYKQFYFKQFNLAQVQFFVHSFECKNSFISFSLV